MSSVRIQAESSGNPAILHQKLFCAGAISYIFNRNDGY